MVTVQGSSPKGETFSKADFGAKKKRYIFDLNQVELCGIIIVLS